jgi:23S rRNA pseudouridine955/2504/2580 synthase
VEPVTSVTFSNQINYISLREARQTVIMHAMSNDAYALHRPAEQLTVGEGNEGQRIDNFLRLRLKGVPKSRIYRILRRGEVRVNRGRIRQDYRLRTGDVVRIPPLRYGSAPPAAPHPAVLERIEASLLFEDAAVLVLNKPSGMAVHGGSGLSYGVIEALRALRPQAPFLELVHRLDRDTSGCLVVAKRRSVLRALHAMLRQKQVEKVYLALVRGRWRGSVRRVEASLRKNLLRSGERMVQVVEDGKSARTEFRALQQAELATLACVTPTTGRTHQIRVHAAHLGHPVAGDEKYGDSDFNARLRDAGLRRLFLHAWELRFVHPLSDGELYLRAPLDEELRGVLANLGLEDPDTDE